MSCGLHCGRSRDNITSRWTFDADSWGDLEISQTFLDGAFAAQIATFIRLNRNVDLVTQPVKVVRVEAAHSVIHAALLGNVKHCWEGLRELGLIGGHVESLHELFEPEAGKHPEYDVQEPMTLLAATVGSPQLSRGCTSHEYFACEVIWDQNDPWGLPSYWKNRADTSIRAVSSPRFQSARRRFRITPPQKRSGNSTI
jgi:hypothetical protein